MTDSTTLLHKEATVRDLAVAHGVSEDTLSQEWDQWHDAPGTDMMSAGAAADAFLGHLRRRGLLGPASGAATTTTTTTPKPVIGGSAPVSAGVAAATTGEDHAKTAAAAALAEAERRIMVKLGSQDRADSTASVGAAASTAAGLDYLDAYGEYLDERARAPSDKPKEVAAIGAAATGAGPSAAEAALAAAERRVLDQLKRTASGKPIVAQERPRGNPDPRSIVSASAVDSKALALPRSPTSTEAADAYRRAEERVLARLKSGPTTAGRRYRHRAGDDDEYEGEDDDDVAFRRGIGTQLRALRSNSGINLVDYRGKSLEEMTAALSGDSLAAGRHLYDTNAYDDDDDDYDDDDGDYDDAYDGGDFMGVGDNLVDFVRHGGGGADDDDNIHSVGEPLEVGQRRLFNWRRFRGGARKAATLAATGAFARWAHRHFDQPQESIANQGRLLGKQLGETIRRMDEVGRRRRVAEPSGAQHLRATAVVRVLVGAAHAAAGASDAARQYFGDRFSALSADLERYEALIRGDRPLSAIPPEEEEEAPEESGDPFSAADDATDRKLMERAVMLIANTATRQLTEPGLEEFGAGADVSARIDRLERQILAGLVRTPRGMRRLASTYINGRAMALIDMLRSATISYVSYPALRVPHSHLAGDARDAITAAMARVPPARPIGAALADANISTAATATTTTVGDGIPATSRALAADLVKRATAYLDRNPTVTRRAGADFALLVPADAACISKIRGHLAGGDDDAERYIRGALLARHPNAACDKAGHMLTLSGTVFHVAPADATGSAAPLVGADVRVTQMLRQDEPSPHDDVWDAELRAGAAGLLSHTGRLPMLCTAGEPLRVCAPGTTTTTTGPAASSSSPSSPSTTTPITTITLRPLYYRPQSQPAH